MTKYYFWYLERCAYFETFLTLCNIHLVAIIIVILLNLRPICFKQITMNVGLKNLFTRTDVRSECIMRYKDGKEKYEKRREFRYNHELIIAEFVINSV